MRRGPPSTAPVYAPSYGPGPGSVYGGYAEREGDWTGARGFDYDKYGRAELIGVYTSETPKAFRPGHFYEERADGRADLPPTEVIVHPPAGLHGQVREHVVQRAPPPVVVPPPAPVVERRAVREAAYQPRQPMNVEIEYREHIRYPDGHVEHSRPVFDYVERDRYLATHPQERAAAASAAYSEYGTPPVVVNEGPVRAPVRRRPPPY